MSSKSTDFSASSSHVSTSVGSNKSSFISRIHSVDQGRVDGLQVLVLIRRLFLSWNYLAVWQKSKNWNRMFDGYIEMEAEDAPLLVYQAKNQYVIAFKVTMW